MIVFDSIYLDTIERLRTVIERLRTPRDAKNRDGMVTGRQRWRHKIVIFTVFCFYFSKFGWNFLIFGANFLFFWGRFFGFWGNFLWGRFLFFWGNFLFKCALFYKCHLEMRLYLRYEKRSLPALDPHSFTFCAE